MHLVLLGSPGAGKGTQAEKLKNKLDLVHIAPGDLLREVVRQKTLLEQKAESYMREGKLVPDDIILELIEDKIDKENKGFILDGFPRNLFQAEKLEEILNRRDIKLDLVINLEVEEPVIIERLSGRLVCSQCGRIYNKRNLAGSRRNCLVCGAFLFQRSDDNPEAIIERIRTYLEHTRPLIDYYKKKKILYSVQAGGSAEETFQKIIDLLDKKERNCLKKN